MSDELTKRAVESLERISIVLGALYAQQLGKMDQGRKAEKLSHLGFSNVQIADALGTTPNAIGVALHRSRSGNAASQDKPKRKRASR